MRSNLGTKTQRKTYGAETKAKVAVAAIKGESTANEIASLYGIHPVQVTKWKKQALEGLPQIFGNGRAVKAEEDRTASLYQQIGQLKVELDWLKKKSGLL